MKVHNMQSSFEKIDSQDVLEAAKMNIQLVHTKN